MPGGWVEMLSQSEKPRNITGPIFDPGSQNGQSIVMSCEQVANGSPGRIFLRQTSGFSSGTAFLQDGVTHVVKQPVPALPKSLRVSVNTLDLLQGLASSGKIVGHFQIAFADDLGVTFTEQIQSVRYSTFQGVLDGCNGHMNQTLDHLIENLIEGRQRYIVCGMAE